MRELVLYSRQGCCLCEGLESRLGDLELSKLELVLQVIDIDAPEMSPAIRARFDLEVPVLAVGSRVLPRVSPRLQGEGLFDWVQRMVEGING
tara:strand:- start:364 stop:639 length:276 start_codon:yes stop_codon:yes gene_type:complete